MVSNSHQCQPRSAGCKLVDQHFHLLLPQFQIQGRMWKTVPVHLSEALHPRAVKANQQKHEIPKTEAEAKGKQRRLCQQNLGLIDVYALLPKTTLWRTNLVYFTIRRTSNVRRLLSLLVCVS